MRHRRCSRSVALPCAAAARDVAIGPRARASAARRAGRLASSGRRRRSTNHRPSRHRVVADLADVEDPVAASFRTDGSVSADGAVLDRRCDHPVAELDAHDARSPWFVSDARGRARKDRRRLIKTAHLKRRHARSPELREPEQSTHRRNIDHDKAEYAPRDPRRRVRSTRPRSRQHFTSKHEVNAARIRRARLKYLRAIPAHQRSSPILGPARLAVNQAHNSCAPHAVCFLILVAS